MLSGNEWAGSLQRMKNAFQQGKLPVIEREEIEAWFDHSLRTLVKKEILQKLDARQ